MLMNTELSSALKVPERTLQEILSAVAAYATHAAASPIPPTWLAARACWSIGAAGAAQTLAGNLVGPNADIAAALHNGGFVPGLAWLLHLGVVRPMRWRHAPDTLTWILDFGKLRRDADGELALACRQGLQLVLDTMAGLWDASSGSGALVLKGWPPPQNRRRRAPAAGWPLDEAEAFCRDLLARQQARRGWHALPHILRLR
jgi:hypothetical protein